MSNRYHELAVEKGWWDGVPRKENGNFRITPTLQDEKLMLIVGELSEAMEEARKFPVSELNKTYYRADGKPEGFVIELADAYIRQQDLLGALGCGYADIDAFVYFLCDSSSTSGVISALYRASKSVEDMNFGAILNKISESVGGNLSAAIAEKHEFNKTRPRRHGGKLA